MVKVLGVEMSKGNKRTVYICTSVAVICLIVYLVLALFEKPPAVQVLMPSGGLTESIFDSQNIVYRAEKSYTVRNNFSHIPYSMDTVDGKTASIGNATIYEYVPFYFYYSEIKEGTVLEDVLRMELTSVLSVSAKPEQTELNVLMKESGFINGCIADFYVYQVKVHDEKETKEQYLCLYKLRFNPSIYSTDWSMLVGCISNDYSTEGLDALQTLSYSSLHTLRYDAAAAKTIE